jgi:predicted ABC-type ATPase
MNVKDLIKDYKDNIGDLESLIAAKKHGKECLKLHREMRKQAEKLLAFRQGEDSDKRWFEAQKKMATRTEVGMSLPPEVYKDIAEHCHFLAEEIYKDKNPAFAKELLWWEKEFNELANETDVNSWPYGKYRPVDDIVKFNASYFSEIVANADPKIMPFIQNRELQTEHVYKIGKEWIPERKKLHEATITKTLSQGTIAAKRGAKPVLCLTGGGSASGKGRLTKMFTNEAKKGGFSRAVMDADEMKKALPEYQVMSQAIRSAAAQAHEESSYLVKTCLARALKEGRDAIYDATLKNAEKTLKIFADARENGYNLFVRGMFCDIAVATERSRLRALRTGREVPNDVIVDAHKGFSAAFPILEKNMNYPAGDRCELYCSDAVENELVLVFQNGSVKDKDLWQRFLAIKDQQVSEETK